MRCSEKLDLEDIAKNKQRILHERAEKLAHINESTQTSSNQIEVVQFMLADERYAIESTYIREVYPLRDVTYLPCVPEYIHGVINVRRRILSVIDLKQFFELTSEKDQVDHKAIILEGEEMEFAIVADSIEGVRTIDVNNIQPGLPTLTGIRQKYLKGVHTDRTVILDGFKLLNDENIVLQQNV